MFFVVLAVNIILHEYSDNVVNGAAPRYLLYLFQMKWSSADGAKYRKIQV